MFSYLSSYFVAAAEEPLTNSTSNPNNNEASELNTSPKKFDLGAGDEMNQYNKSPTDAQDTGSSSLPSDSEEGPSQAQAAPGGIMNTIYTRMSGHPVCTVVIDYPDADRKYLRAGDDLKGKVQIKAAVEG